MKPLRFFLVGCGRISHRHIRAIRENREQGIPVIEEVWQRVLAM